MPPSQNLENPVLLTGSQQTQPLLPTPTPTQETTSPIQMPLVSECANVPWGDIWSLNSPMQPFCVFSKNTGTINPLNLDMHAITTKLQNLGASVFAAQETNIHWDLATTHQIYTQCWQAHHMCS